MNEYAIINTVAYISRHFLLLLFLNLKNIVLSRLDYDLDFQPLILSIFTTSRRNIVDSS